jgi:ribosomal protein S13
VLAVRGYDTKVISIFMNIRFYRGVRVASDIEVNGQLEVLGTLGY